MSSFKLTPVISMPNIARSSTDLLKWADRIHWALTNRDIEVVDRLENYVLVADLADMPAADGQRRLFYAVDTMELFLDVYDETAATASWVLIASQSDPEYGTITSDATGLASIVFAGVYPVADGIPNIQITASPRLPKALPATMTYWINVINSGVNYTGVDVLVADNAGNPEQSATVFWSGRKA